MIKKQIDYSEPFTENYKFNDSETKKAYELLRRVYKEIELQHLNDNKMNRCYCDSIDFPRSLGDDIFNLLQSKDNIFRQSILRRQKNYRRKMKKANVDMTPYNKNKYDPHK